MSSERLIYLLTKKRSGEITLEEQLELSGLLKADAEDSLLVKAIDELFDSSLGYEKEVSGEDVSKALSVLHERIRGEHGISNTPNKPKFRRLKQWLVAASVLLIAGISIFYLQQNEHPFKNSNVITTKMGSKTDLELPDGTKVWVNADTRLSYDKDFGNGTREVTLVGEAYFDVTKDKTRPFIVHTATMDVKVLGTAFNVRAYKNETNAQATLIRGAVEVILKKKSNKTLLLAPNEKIIVANEAKYEEKTGKALTPATEAELIKLPTTKKDSLINEIQWVQNRIVFDQEKLENIIPVLERWYNIKIEQNAKNPSRLYSGIFENDSLEDPFKTKRAP